MNTIKELNQPNKDDMQNLQKDFGKVVRELKEAKESLYAVLAETKLLAKNAVQESVEQLRLKSTTAQENVKGYVKSNPFKTLGLAVLIGVLTSKLVSK